MAASLLYALHPDWIIVLYLLLQRPMAASLLYVLHPDWIVVLYLLLH